MFLNQSADNLWCLAVKQWCDSKYADIDDQDLP